MKKAIGLVQGAWWNGGWTVDQRLQKKQIKEYADAEEYELVSFYTFEATLSVIKKRAYKNFFSALKRSNESNATILYVDLGRWRRFPLFTDLLKNNETKKGKLYDLVPITPEVKTIEAIEKHSRLVKYRKSIKKVKLSEETKKKTQSPLLQWKEQNNITTRRLNNFKHLYEGVLPIYKKIEEMVQKNEPIKVISASLNANYHLTVDGKRWSRHSVAKTIPIIESKEFKEYVELRKEVQKAIDVD